MLSALAALLLGRFVCRKTRKGDHQVSLHEFLSVHMLSLAEGMRGGIWGTLS